MKILFNYMHIVCAQGFEVVHKADAQKRAYAAVHGVFTATFCEQVQAAAERPRPCQAATA